MNVQISSHGDICTFRTTAPAMARRTKPVAMTNTSISAICLSPAEYTICMVIYVPITSRNIGDRNHAPIKDVVSRMAATIPAILIDIFPAAIGR